MKDTLHEQLSALIDDELDRSEQALSLIHISEPTRL